MGFLTDWGFSSQSWQGRRGEYWLLLQALCLIGFATLPVYRPEGWNLPSPPCIYWMRGGAAILAAIAAVFLCKGLLDLGHNLTPLPYPKDDGELVQTGVYGIIRHPLYGGIILAAIAWTLWQLSLSHLIGTFVLLMVLNAKASREETWLTEKYPEYPNYRQRTKKLIPWVY
ncbi:MAG: isoprenylcysteine carboxylmethyltransferase family protein [Kovacikia sp.]